MQVGTELIEVLEKPVKHYTMVQRDIAEGHRQWREHLKRTNCVELGHGDLKASVAQQAKKHGYRKKKAILPSHSGQITQLAPSQAMARVMERLEGRPRASRAEVIKMAIEEVNRGRRK